MAWEGRVMRLPGNRYADVGHEAQRTPLALDRDVAREDRGDRRPQSPRRLLVCLYLVAIVAANLSIAAFGPAASVVNAFLFIGLDLTARDRLHDAWSGRGLRWKMGALIVTGGVLSFALNRDAGVVAVASTVAFVVAGALDAMTYTLMERRSRMARVNGSNIAAAAADSLIFPTIAFGSFLPAVVIAQFAAKVAGGFVWSLILRVRR